jgi:hypothetical protein
MPMDEIELENGQARVETDGLTVQEQVKRAYADAHGIDNGYDQEKRCLSFLTDQWVDPQEAGDLVAFIGPYNAFDPDTVADKFYTLVTEADVNFRVAIGREGSPALYFATDEPEKIRRVFESYADEFAEVEAPDIAGKERYREDDYPVEEHGSCRHDQPPVPQGHEVRGDPERDVTYLRAWWD